MIEVWKQIPGYENLYEASEKGQIRSIRKCTSSFIGKILKQKKQGNGYQVVVLHKKGVPKTILVHKLILLTFLGEKPTPKHQCNHIDGNKSNNSIGNLEWVTASQNQIHKCYVLGKTLGADNFQFGKTGEKSLLAKKYIATNPEGVEHVVVGLKKFCLDNGLTPSGMFETANGRYQKHKGWRCRHA